MDQHLSSIAVVFGPSRSKFFSKAVAFARAVASEIAELEPGRYRAVFVLGTNPDAYTNSSALIHRVRQWRGSEVYLGRIPLSPAVVSDMGWCAGDQLRHHGTCRNRFFAGVPKRCPPCPLYEPDRAEREMRGEGAPPPFEIEVGPNLRLILQGEVPPGFEMGADPGEIPDFLPEHWEEPSG